MQLLLGMKMQVGSKEKLIQNEILWEKENTRRS